MKALMDLTARSFHFRQSLDICISGIARLDSYEKSTTSRKDTPLKIRQDLLATNDIIDLALHLRRFSEITNSRKRIGGISLTAHLLQFEGGKAVLKSEDFSLYDLVSRLIHSKTSAVCRNMFHLFLHFDAKSIPKNLLEPPWGTKAVVVVDTDLKPKQFCFLREVLDSSNDFIMAICNKDAEILAYLNKRPF